MAPPAEDIKSVLTAISELDVERDLIQTPRLGSAGDFSAWRDLFDEIVDFARLHADLPWQKLPANRISSTRDQLQQVFRALGDIQGFSPSPIRRDTPDSHARNLHQRFGSFNDEFLPLLSHLRLESIDLDQYRRDLERLVTEGRETNERLSYEYQLNMQRLNSEYRESVDQLITEVRLVKSETEDALMNIRAVAAEAGVSQEAATFHDAAERYDSTAKRWLIGAIVAAMVTVSVGISIVMAWNSLGDLTGVAAWQVVLGRAAVLVVLSFAAVTAVRMYRSNAHLAAVNRHREDALRTFNAFIDGTESSEVKDMILLAAAHAAFGQTATGLVGEKADGSNTLEVFEGLFGRSMRG